MSSKLQLLDFVSIEVVQTCDGAEQVVLTIGPLNFDGCSVLQQCNRFLQPSPSKVNGGVDRKSQVVTVIKDCLNCCHLSLITQGCAL